MMSANADITSCNTVGYNTVTVEAGKWYMLAPQFEDVANPGQDTIDLLKTLTTTGIKAQTYANRLKGSEIQVYNPATKGYTHYYYVQSGSGASAVTQWRSSPAVPSSFPVKVGSGVWLHVVELDGETATLTFNGQVKSATTFTKNVGGDNGEWDIISNPYPVALTLGMLTTEGLTAQTYANRLKGSEIQVYNPATSGYTHYYYVQSGSGASIVKQWRNTPAAPADSTVLVGVGGSVWIHALDEGTLTFTLNQ